MITFCEVFCGSFSNQLWWKTVKIGAKIKLKTQGTPNVMVYFMVGEPRPRNRDSGVYQSTKANLICLWKWVGLGIQNTKFQPEPEVLICKFLSLELLLLRCMSSLNHCNNFLQARKNQITFPFWNFLLIVFGIFLHN